MLSIQFRKRLKPLSVILAAIVFFSAALSALDILTIKTSAYNCTVDGGIFRVTDTSFTIPAGGKQLLGADEGKELWYTMDIPGGGPNNEKPSGSKAVLEQNYSLWKEIESVEVTFLLSSSSPSDKDFSGLYIMSYAQLGGGADFKWLDNTTNAQFTDIPKVTETGEFCLNKLYTVVYYPAAICLAEEKPKHNSGILRMGLLIGNNGKDNLDYTISFTDVKVKGNTDIIDKYSEIAQRISPSKSVISAETDAPAVTVDEASDTSETSKALETSASNATTEESVIETSAVTTETTSVSETTPIAESTTAENSAPNITSTENVKISAAAEADKPVDASEYGEPSETRKSASNYVSATELSASDMLIIISAVLCVIAIIILCVLLILKTGKRRK